jgi:hypothetical protein
MLTPGVSVKRSGTKRGTSNENTENQAYLSPQDMLKLFSSPKIGARALAHYVIQRNWTHFGIHNCRVRQRLIRMPRLWALFCVGRPVNHFSDRDSSVIGITLNPGYYADLNRTFRNSSTGLSTSYILLAASNPSHSRDA